MAQIVERANIELVVSLVLTEEEALALDGMCEYGSKNVVEALRRGIGESYVAKHEKGIVSFVQAIQDELPPILGRAKAARESFCKKK